MLVPYQVLAAIIDFANLSIDVQYFSKSVVSLEPRYCCCSYCQYRDLHYQICSDRYSLTLVLHCLIFRVVHFYRLGLHLLWPFSFYCAQRVLSQSVSNQGFPYVIKPTKASFTCKLTALQAYHQVQGWSVLLLKALLVSYS